MRSRPVYVLNGEEDGLLMITLPIDIMCRLLTLCAEGTLCAKPTKDVLLADD
jgi:hypothetical protein